MSLPPPSMVLGLLGPALLAWTVVLAGMDYLPAARGLGRPWRWALPAGIAAAVLVPFGALSAAAYLRGIVGDFSITTLLLLLGGQIVGRLTGRPLPDRRSRTAAYVCLAAAGAALYPMTLGAGPYDPYRLGFGSAPMLLALLALAALGWRAGVRTAVFIPLAVLAWQLRVMESTNLWDYLLDPLVALYCLAWLGLTAGWRIARRLPWLPRRCGASAGPARS